MTISLGEIRMLNEYFLFRLMVLSTGVVVVVVVGAAAGVTGGGGDGVLVLVKTNRTLGTRRLAGGCGLGTTWILGLGVCGFTLTPACCCCCLLFF